MAYGDLATMISTQHEDLLDFIADVSPDKPNCPYVVIVFAH